MAKLVLTQGQQDALKSFLMVVGIFAGILVDAATSVGAPWNYIFPIAGPVIGHIATDLSTVATTGTTPSVTQVATDIAPLWSGVIKAQAEAEVKKYVTDPTQQALALAVIGTVDQKIQALAPQTPVSPLAALAAAKPAVVS